MIVRRYFFSFFSRKQTGPHNRFSQRIIGSFYIIFCNMRAKSSLPQEGSPVSAFIFDHFSFNPAPQSTAVPANNASDKTSKWKFNERFRSHNGTSLMSCNDLHAGGHASMLFSFHYASDSCLTMVWTLLIVHFLHSTSLHCRAGLRVSHCVLSAPL